MKNFTCQEIRNEWIKFFTSTCSSQHKHIGSSSLVPDNPTLLLNSAGMVQFVPIFLGMKPAPQPPRAVTIQKCARVGGKDSDLENIGRTTRHHSFFEMLGNFSFGDYFKAEVIPWAWQFLREVLNIPADKLFVSVFAGDQINAFDQEAYDIWQKVLIKDFPESQEREKHIWRLSRKDNFWGPPGPTGPCGPCSEIYFDLGDHVTNHDDRYVEIWNLVFMQLEKNDQGEYIPLKQKNIDTGAGLERLATVLQIVKNSFETNELFDILQSLAKALGKPYGVNNNTDLYLKIITDHLRCLCFLIADGVRPSNLGRGYVLRMIIRRAARFLYLLRSQTGAFLFNQVESVVRNYSQAYPELNLEIIQDVCRKEEELFAQTIVNGIDRLNDKLAHQVEKQLDGVFVFDLYSTYGFPLELTQEIAQEKGFTVDQEAFDLAREQHSKASSTQSFNKSLQASPFVMDVLQEYGATKFVGYECLEIDAKVLAIFQDSENLQIILDQTPFHAESGGQASDQGFVEFNGQEFEVVDVRKIENIIIHVIKNTDIKVGDKVKAKVNSELRQATKQHHTTAHLLQAALRKTLGNHVMQMGSAVGPEYTRFDFNFERALNSQELVVIEKQVNDWVSLGLPVQTQVMNYDDAVKTGALSFFEEKYQDQVRVLRIANDQIVASIELCSGTHVSNTKEIQEVILASEGSVAAGIRRIKMLAGDQARKYQEEKKQAELKANQQVLLKEQAKDELRRVIQEQAKILQDNLDKITKLIKKQKDVSVLIFSLQDVIAQEFNSEAVKSFLENLVNDFKVTKQKYFILLASQNEGKVIFFSASSMGNAATAVKEAAQICGGNGGGKPDFAQAGAKDIGKIQEALEQRSKAIAKELDSYSPSPL